MPMDQDAFGYVCHSTMLEVVLVPILSAELVRRLARQKGGPNPVVSLYLNVDGRANLRPEDFHAHLDGLIRDHLAKGATEAVAADLERVRAYVTKEFKRGSNRGLALFCSGDEMWEVVPLPLPVANHLVVNSSPHIRELEVLIDEHPSLGILVTDKQRARLLVVEMNSVVEREEVLDPLPRHDDDKGDWSKDHIKNHSTISAANHFRHAAHAMFTLYQRHRFDDLVLAVAEEHKTVLEKELHAYLRTRVVGVAPSLSVQSSDEDLIRVATELSQRAERKREADIVDKLRSGMGSAHSSVAGLAPTLEAIFEKRVDTLLISEGFSKEGWRCAGCNCIAAVGRTCPKCGDDMTLVEDIVEEAVEDALGQNCRVEFCLDNADLDVIGRIGALLRF